MNFAQSKSVIETVKRRGKQFSEYPSYFNGFSLMSSSTGVTSVKPSILTSSNLKNKSIDTSSKHLNARNLSSSVNLTSTATSRMKMNLTLAKNPLVEKTSSAMNLKTNLSAGLKLDTSTKLSSTLSTKSSPSLNLSNKLLVTSNLTTKTGSLSLKRKTETSSDFDEEVKKHRICVVENGDVVELNKMKVDLTQPGKTNQCSLNTGFNFNIFRYYGN